MGVATPVASLDTLFRLVGQNVRLVVLNACFSDAQARTLSQHVDAVIGMTRAIGDPTAISFAKSFYAALADGRNLETAFNLACTEAGFEEFKGGEIPTLIASPAARARTFVDA